MQNANVLEEAFVDDVHVKVFDFSECSSSLNVKAYTRDGFELWTLKPSGWINTTSPGPFVGITLRDDGSVWLLNSEGWAGKLDVVNGFVTECVFTK
jgi:hypothetical protein